ARIEGSLRAKKFAAIELFRQLAKQPSPTERPEAVGGAAADAQSFGRFLMGETGKVTQLDESGRVAVVVFQPAQRLVQRDEIVTTGLGGGEVGEIDAQPAAAVLVGQLASRLIHEDAAHRLGRGRKEVAAAVPVLCVLGVNQS